MRTAILRDAPPHQDSERRARMHSVTRGAVLALGGRICHVAPRPRAEGETASRRHSALLRRAWVDHNQRDTASAAAVSLFTAPPPLRQRAPARLCRVTHGVCFLAIGGRRWHIAPRMRTERESHLAITPFSNGAQGGLDQRGMEHAHRKLEWCAYSPETASADAPVLRDTRHWLGVGRPQPPRRTTTVRRRREASRYLSVLT